MARDGYLTDDELASGDWVPVTPPVPSRKQLSDMDLASGDWVDVAKMAKSAPEQVLGTGLNVLDTALLGTGDEVVSGLQAPIRAYSEGIPLGEAYDQNLGITRQTMAKFREDNPKTALGLNVVGGIISPASKLGFGTNTLGNSVRTGITQGGLYGFGSGEGDLGNRIESGGIGAAGGGIISGGLKLAGSGVKALGEWAGDERLSKVAQILGINKNDWNKSAKNGQTLITEDGTVLTKLDDAVKYVDENLDVANLGERKILPALKAKMEEGYKPVTAAIEETDKVLAEKGYRVMPRKSNLLEANKYIDDIKEIGAEGKQVLKEDLHDRITNKYKKGLNGSLSDMQKEKQYLQRTTYGSDPLGKYKKGLDGALAKDFQRIIEEVSDRFSGQAEGTVAKANAAYGKMKTIKDLSSRTQVSRQNPSQNEGFFKVFKTSGGSLTSPILAGGAAGAGVGQLIGSPGLGMGVGTLLGAGLGVGNLFANTDSGRKLILKGLQNAEAYAPAVARGMGYVTDKAIPLMGPVASSLGLTPAQRENAAAYEYPYPTTSQYDELIARLTGR